MKSSPSRDLPGAAGNAAECTDANVERFSRGGTIAASVGDYYKNWDRSAGFQLTPNVLPTRQCLPLNASCGRFNCPLPSSRMLKKSTSIVLASLRGSTDRRIRLASSLAAALLDSLFEHPGECSPCIPDVQIIEVPLCHTSPSAAY